MPTFVISFHEKSVGLEAAESIAADVANFFQLALKPPIDPVHHRAAIVAGKNPDKFTLAYEGSVRASEVSRGEVLARLAATIARETYEGRSEIILQAGLIGWSENTALVIGASGSGKTSLIAWMIERGFAYLADEAVLLTADAGVVAGFPEPLSFGADHIDHLGDVNAVRNAASVRAGKRLLVCPERNWLAVRPKGRVGLILSVRHQPGSAFQFEPVSPEVATVRLAEATRFVTLPSDPGYKKLEALASSAPMLAITYGSFGQLEGMIDFLTRAALGSDAAPGEFERFIRNLPKPATAPVPLAVTSTPKTYPIPVASDRVFKDRKLTIGMATFDDFDGVYFSIQSARLYHAEFDKQIEFIVVDNHPDGPCSGALKRLEEWIPNYRYVPNAGEASSSGSKNRVFKEANGEFVLCMDCHVMIVPGAIEGLFKYLAANPVTDNLLQGPLLYDDMRTVGTHYTHVWKGGFLGQWGTDSTGTDASGPPYDIGMQGLGLFVARRASWLGFNPGFRGFGGEEGYLHEKYRKAGRRTLSLPFLRWLHRFPRPMGVPYPLNWPDRIHNYVLGFHELGLPTDEMEAHFRELLGVKTSDRLFREARQALNITPS